METEKIKGLRIILQKDPNLAANCKEQWSMLKSELSRMLGPHLTFKERDNQFSGKRDASMLKKNFCQRKFRINRRRADKISIRFVREYYL